MLKQIGSAAVLVVAAAVSTLFVATPAAAQVSLYRMDFQPSDVIPGGGVGPTNYTMPDFGWDDTHAQAGLPGVYFPNVPGLNPEDPTNRAFVYLFGSIGQTASTFTSSNATVGSTVGSTFPVGGIDPTLPANAGLGFSWSQHLENGVNVLPIHVRLAVQTAAGNWYVSNGVFDTGTTGAGSQGNFDPQVLTYNPAKANWLGLTIGATAVEGVTVGAQPAANLTGNITGVGFVAAFSANASTTVHIDFLDVGIPPVPGDVDGDRIVDLIHDYATIKNNFGTNVASRVLGDVTGDGVVNLFDFAQWKDNFPFPAGGDGSMAYFNSLLAAVPEPSSAALMTMALPLGLGMRRRRNGKQKTTRQT